MSLSVKKTTTGTLLIQCPPDSPSATWHANLKKINKKQKLVGPTTQPPTFAPLL